VGCRATLLKKPPPSSHTEFGWSKEIFKEESSGVVKVGLMHRRSLKLNFLALETTVELCDRHLKLHGEFRQGRSALLADLTLSAAYRIERSSETRWRIHAPPGSRNEGELAFELCAASARDADDWVSCLQEACLPTAATQQKRERSL